MSALAQLVRQTRVKNRGSKLSRLELAKEVLKKAILNDVLRDVLWGGGGPEQQEKIEKIKKIVTDGVNALNEEEMEDFFDEKLEWNGLLMDRILKTYNSPTKARQYQALRGSDKENDGIDSDHSTDEKAKEVAMAHKALIHHKMPRSRSKAKRRVSHAVTAPSIGPSPDKFDFNRSIKTFDVLPNLSAPSQSFIHLSGGSKPKRVMQIMREIKALGALEEARLREEAPESDDSEEEEEEEENYDDFGTDEYSQSYLKRRMGMSQQGAPVDINKQPSSVRKKMQSKDSIDVVAGLFEMSNELRQERENILTHNTDAFLNRELTLKYNDELEEVVQNKAEENMNQRRAAVLRLRRNAAKFKVSGSSLPVNFSMFWGQLLTENHKRNANQVYERLFAAQKAERERRAKRQEKPPTPSSPIDTPAIAERRPSGSLTPKSPSARRTSLRKSLSKSLSHKSIDAMSEVSEAASAVSHVDIHTIMEENLSMLATTKARASIFAKRNSSRRSSSATLETLQATAAASTVEAKALVQQANQLNLVAMIDKMKSMGLYSNMNLRSSVAAPKSADTHQAVINMIASDLTPQQGMRIANSPRFSSMVKKKASLIRGIHALKANQAGELLPSDITTSSNTSGNQESTDQSSEMVSNLRKMRRLSSFSFNVNSFNSLLHTSAQQGLHVDTGDPDTFPERETNNDQPSLTADRLKQVGTYSGAYPRKSISLVEFDMEKLSEVSKDDQSDRSHSSYSSQAMMPPGYFPMQSPGKRGKMKKMRSFKIPEAAPSIEIIGRKASENKDDPAVRKQIAGLLQYAHLYKVDKDLPIDKRNNFNIYQDSSDSESETDPSDKDFNLHSLLETAITEKRRETSHSHSVDSTSVLEKGLPPDYLRVSTGNAETPRNFPSRPPSAISRAYSPRATSLEPKQEGGLPVDGTSSLTPHQNPTDQFHEYVPYPFPRCAALNRPLGTKGEELKTRPTLLTENAQIDFIAPDERGKDEVVGPTVVGDGELVAAMQRKKFDIEMNPSAFLRTGSPEHALFEASASAVSHRHEVKTAPESLVGRWNYDKGLDEFRVYPVQKRPPIPRRIPRSAKRARTPFPLKKTRDDYKEIVFNPETLDLSIITHTFDAEPKHLNIDINTIYMTQSIYEDMITLRTSDTEKVSSGYIGTFFAVQWSKVEQEINLSLLNYANFLTRQRQLRSQEYEQSQLLKEDSVVLKKDIDADIFLTKVPDQDIESEKRDSQEATENETKEEIKEKKSELDEGYEYQPYRWQAPTVVAEAQIARQLTVSPPVPFFAQLQLEQQQTRAKTAGQAPPSAASARRVATGGYENMIREGMVCKIPVEMHGSASPTRLPQRYTLTAVGVPAPMGQQAISGFVKDNPANALASAGAFGSKPLDRTQGFREESISPARETRKETEVRPGVSLWINDTGAGATFQPQRPTFPAPSTAPSPRRVISRFEKLISTGSPRNTQSSTSSSRAEQKLNLQDTATHVRAVENWIQQPNNGSSVDEGAGEPSVVAESAEFSQLLAQSSLLSSSVEPVSFAPLKTGYMAEGYSAQGEEVFFLLNGVAPPSVRSPISRTKQRTPLERNKEINAKTSTPEEKDASLSLSIATNELTVILPSSPKEQKPSLSVTVTERIGKRDKLELQSNADSISSTGIEGEEEVHDIGTFDDFDDYNVEIPKFSYDYQIVMLVESRRIMQLYFAKKFLQLDIMVNVHLTPHESNQSIQEYPGLYGVIFVSYVDLAQLGVEYGLRTLIPADLDRQLYSVIVYDVGELSDESLQVLESCGVSGILEEPYSLTNIRSVLEAHQRKQEMLFQYNVAHTPLDDRIYLG